MTFPSMIRADEVLVGDYVVGPSGAIYRVDAVWHDQMVHWSRLTIGDRVIWDKVCEAEILVVYREKAA